MRKIYVVTAIILSVMSGCANPEQKADSSNNKKIVKMKNLVSIIEIPTTDFARAIKFYEGILGLQIEQTEMAGTQMGVLPADEQAVSVVLVKGQDYQPTATGAVVYLNAGEDLQTILEKITPNGGQILVPKTEISPEMGYFALFMDTEGNRLGLHSSK